MSNYASGGKHMHAKHLYILAVNLPDTFRCPKRQIATKKYKIICLSSMFYLNQKKKQCKVQFAHCLFKICPPINDSIQADFWPFSYGVTHLLRKQYPYIWLPFQYHSIFVIYVCRISAAIIQRSTQACWVSFSNASDIVCSLSIPKFGIPTEQNFMPSFPCFLENV